MELSLVQIVLCALYTNTFYLTVLYLLWWNIAIMHSSSKGLKMKFNYVYSVDFTICLLFSFSDTASKQRAMLEQAGLTSGAAIIVVIVVIVCFYLYVRSRRKFENGYVKFYYCCSSFSHYHFCTFPFKVENGITHLSTI